MQELWDAALETVRQRLHHYERMIRLSTGVGAGLLAEVTVFASLQINTTADLKPARIAGAVFVTVFFAASALILACRGWIEWQRDMIKRLLRERDANGSPKLKLDDTMQTASGADEKYRVQFKWDEYERAYGYGLNLTVLGAMVLISHAWIQALCKP